MRRVSSLSLIGLLVGLLFSWQGASVEAAVSGEPIISVEATEIVFSWQLPPAETAVVDGYTTVTMAGLETLQEPGLPQLPTRSFLLAVPDGAEPTLFVTDLVEMERPYPIPLAIAPQPDGLVFNAAGEAIGGGYVAAEAQPFDKPIATLEEAGTMRGVRLARLTIYPVRPKGNVLQIAQRVDLRIALNASVALNRLSAPTEMDALTQMVAGAVINPSQVMKQTRADRPAATQVVDGDVKTAVVAVDKVGITAVTYANLATGGFPVGSINPQKMHLTRDGVEVAMEWVGDGDAQFESNENFLFYAQPWFNRWMNEDVYLLRAEASNGLRIANLSGSPGNLAASATTRRQLIEENHIYFSGCAGCDFSLAGHDGDHWFWDDLRNPGDRPSGSYPFTLSNVDSSQSAKMTMWLIGSTNDPTVNPDHKMDVLLNGSLLGSVTWDGKTAVSKTFTIPPNRLQNNNTLQLNLLEVADVNGVLFDAVQIEYTQGNAPLGATTQMQFMGKATPHAYTVPMASTSDARVYNVTNPINPTKLSGLQVSGNQIRFGDALSGVQEYAIATSGSVHSPATVRLATPLLGATGADYVIIAPQAFMAATAPLQALRQGQGMSVVVEDVQAIYDGFGYGRSTPEAIHNYLDDAYHNWSPTPEFVLLVGDGTYDPKLHKPDSRSTWIPPYLVSVDPWLGEIAADNRFVTVDGSDVLPDMAIGRLPVNIVAEAQSVINKIVQYEANPHFGDWNSKVLAITDNNDSAGNFAQFSDALINKYVGDPWSATKHYYNPALNATVGEKEALKNEIYTAVLSEWNQGRGIVMYTGHSSTHQWAVERLFHLDDVASLNNYGRLPIVLQMTCFTSSFQEPFWDTLDEALLRRENGGAVATWGPTGLGVATGHDALADGFLETVISNDTPQLGRATMAGKLNLLAHSPSNVDLMDTFTLLGDPATRYDFDFWPGFDTFLPIAMK